MARIVPPAGWKPLGLDDQCQNWRIAYDGSEVKMGCRSAAMQSLAHAANHLLARHPRVIHHYVQDPSLADDSGIQPLMRWRYLDDFDNARHYTVHLICLVPESMVDGWYAAQWSSATYYAAANKTVAVPLAKNVPDLWGDVWYLSFRVTRGGPGDTVVEDGLSTYDGCTVLACTVTEDPVSELDSSLHTCCLPKIAAPGRAVVADAAEDIRAAYQERRATGLPLVLSWCAQGTTATTAAPGDSFVRTVSSATYVNIFDQADVARTATSVGWCMAARYAAHGLDTRVKVMLEVLANAPTNDAAVKFEGSDNIASNSCEVAVTGGGGLAWYGDSGDYVSLDAEAAVDDLTTAMNKIDCLAKVPAGGNIHIYGVRGWALYT